MFRNLIRSAVISGLFVSACDDEKSEPKDDDRGSLGKGDAIGSCEPSNCDSDLDARPEGANCYCDPNCSLWGDCCDNAFDVCDVPQVPAGNGECNDDSKPMDSCGQDLSNFTCPEGQTAALRNGCWTCVDEVTCEPS